MSIAKDYWENFYAERDQVWSGQPNPLLVRSVADLTPGTALDLGCAEGADAVWLASRGWRVTGVDVSTTALDRAAARAVAAGVDITWEQHDLDATFPAGEFDLVSAQFFHSPVDVEGGRAGVLRRAAAAVAPRGLLLIGGHAGWPSWHHGDPEIHFPTTDEVLLQLRLDDRWIVVVQDLVEREIVGPEGQPGTRADNILGIRRVW